MIVNTVSIDTSGRKADGYSVRREAEARLGGSGDPLEILIRLETAAERRLMTTRECITNDREFINTFINRNL